LLPFRENALKGDAQDLFGFAGMKKHFDSNPIGHPANKGGDQGYQYQPVIHKKV
jgi:hypothetical protein